MAKNPIAEKENLAKKFIRVGDEYFKEVYRPNKEGQLFKMWQKRSKTTVTDDLGRGEFFRNIRKFEGYVNIPSHIDYKEVIEGFFNEYNQISHIQKEGKFDNITSLLNHVFGDKVDFALDYIQLLYLKPTQRLPIILLESESKNTGKSTFGQLLALIFQDNSAKIGNSDINSNFNAIWVKRLLIILDETKLESNDVMQMVKRFSTESGKVTSNEKNKAQEQVDFFGKFILMSNDEGKALPIEKGEKRFAVFKVPTFAEKGITDNPEIETEFQKEIPAFLHFLKNRALKHQNESRMFFAPEVYHTPQLDLYFSNSTSYTGKAIYDFIEDSFKYFEDEKELKFSVANLINELQNTTKYIDRAKIKESLFKEFKLTEQKKGRYQYYSLKLAESHTAELYKPQDQNNTFFVFNKTFLKSEILE